VVLPGSISVFRSPAPRADSRSSGKPDTASDTASQAEEDAIEIKIDRVRIQNENCPETSRETDTGSGTFCRDLDWNN
jgi:hypothetical protein